MLVHFSLILKLAVLQQADGSVAKTLPTVLIWLMVDFDLYFVHFCSVVMDGAGS